MTSEPAGTDWTGMPKISWKVGLRQHGAVPTAQRALGIDHRGLLLGEQHG